MGFRCYLDTIDAWYTSDMVVVGTVPSKADTTFGKEHQLHLAENAFHTAKKNPAIPRTRKWTHEKP